MLITLRQVTDADLPLLFEQQRDPLSAQMAGVPSRDEEAFYAHWARVRANPKNFAWVVEADGEVVGNIGSFTWPDHRQVGYWVDRRHWGKGIATRALALLLERDHERPMYAHIIETNVGSKRVLEKCGFRLLEDRGASRGIQAEPDDLVFVLE